MNYHSRNTYLTRFTQDSDNTHVTFEMSHKKYITLSVKETCNHAVFIKYILENFNFKAKISHYSWTL